MSFNSPEFLWFFPLVLILSWLLVNRAGARVWLTILASCYFYACRNPWWMIPFFTSCTIDFGVAYFIPKVKTQAAKKALLLLSLITNFIILGFFKYFNFMGATVASALGVFGYKMSWVDLNIILPAGISFYTFHSLSYTIDVYRGFLKPVKSFSKFAFAVTFFPQLVAGPIVRASSFLPQLEKKPSLDVESVKHAFYLIAMGFFKKIVLGDYLAIYAERAFNTPLAVDPVAAWVGVFAFAFQIYFDFCGYTDIAIGVAKLLGYDLGINFRRPYAATSFSDFWRRWHISLSTWLRDYLYIPLGGNQMKSRWGVYRNVMLTMVIGGFWHGAAWHFVVWGAMHGTFLIFERIMGWRQTEQGVAEKMSFGGLAKRFMIFLCIVATWLVFRCENNKLLGELVWTLVHIDRPVTITYGLVFAMAIILFSWLADVIGDFIEYEKQFLKLPVVLQAILYGLIGLLVIVAASSGEKPFIYFQF